MWTAMADRISFFAHENRVVAEHRDGERLTRLAAFDAGRRHTIIAVDTGDINKNGITEIFVTRLDAHNQLDSVVLEWNGSGLQAIATGQRWYFRAGDDPENGRTLMGQRRGIPSANDTGGLYADAHFMPGVFEMTWNGKNYQAGRRLPLPDDMTSTGLPGEISLMTGQFGPSGIPLPTNCAFTTLPAPPSGPAKKPLAATRFSRSRIIHRCPHQGPDLPDPAFYHCRS
jgi:hypothetical protein